MATALETNFKKKSKIVIFPFLTIKGFQMEVQGKIVIAIAFISQPWQTITLSTYFEKKGKGESLLQLFYYFYDPGNYDAVIRS